MAGVAWAIVTGCLELWVATRMRHELRHAWWWRASAVVSVRADGLLWLRPEADAVAIALVLGVYALIAGGLWLAAAWREYRTRTGRRAPSWSGPASGGPPGPLTCSPVLQARRIAGPRVSAVRPGCREGR